MRAMKPVCLLLITGISATRLGNPADADPTNNFLIRMLAFAIPVSGSISYVCVGRN